MRPRWTGKEGGEPTEWKFDGTGTELTLPVVVPGNDVPVEDSAPVDRHRELLRTAAQRGPLRRERPPRSADRAEISLSGAEGVSVVEGEPLGDPLVPSHLIPDLEDPDVIADLDQALAEIGDGPLH